MNPKRWQQASRILELALERDPDRRSAYLDEVCADDDGLRQEVESLLAASERAGSLLDSPAMEMAAQLFVRDSAESMLGQSIGRYKIISALGAGGMGDVYLAHDTSLGRKVALKLLPDHFTTDRDRLRRFEQEAHAASTLSHTNVCVIHEVGETENGRHYIAMEYVDGVTLRQHLAGTRLGLTDALDVAIQVASALAAAHAGGIVHRDIKPENIMVRSDGTIKVLDFGLAKLTEQPQTIDSELATRPVAHTDTGMVMGTTAYMSPEQARGLAVDARTDIWSLGVVLYEMLAGRPPFEGETASDLIAAILKTEPPALTYYTVDVPSELEHVARKALQKEREVRYQTARDLLNDLNDIKQELEFQAKLERSVQPEVRNQANAARRGGAELQTAEVGEVLTDRLARETSSAEYLINEIRRHKKGVFITLVFSLICGLAYTIYHFSSPIKPAVAHFLSMKIRRVTSDGNVGGATISPDGKYIAYSLIEGGKRSLWTKHLATGSRVQIAPPVEAGGMNPNTFTHDEFSNAPKTLLSFGLIPNTFTHDGSYVYYTRYDQLNPQGALYEVPVLGGASKKILTNIAWPISLSPDGKQLAFGRFYEDLNEDELLVANADGTNERSLLRPSNRPSNPGWLSEAAVAWSPDGKMLATGYGQPDGGDHMGVAIMSVAEGTLKLIPTPRWFHIGPIVWFSDGNAFALQVQEQELGTTQIWQLSYPGGEARRITSDLNSYAGNSLMFTADARALVTVQSEAASNIWIAPSGEASSARPVTSRKNVQDGTHGLTWSPDGRVVYETNINGKRSVWIMNSDGSDPKPLTDSTAYDNQPEVTQDGRFIVFLSFREGMSQLWRMDIDGSNPIQLAEEQKGTTSFCVSPDGQSVVYNPLDDGIWRVSIDGGTPSKLIEKSNARYGRVSPNGKLLAYHFVDDQTKRPRIAVTAFADGAPIKTLDMPMTSAAIFQWSHDGHALIYIDTRNGASNLWSQPLKGGAPKQITDFKSDLIYRFAYARDGKLLAVARGNVSRDAVMISEERPTSRE
jgi:serine/threonine protein kinase